MLKSIPKTVRLACSVVVAFLATSSTGLAQSTSATRASEESTQSGIADALLGDVAEYATAPFRWDEQDWLEFGATLAAVGVAHHFDERVRSHFTVASSSALSGKSTNDVRDALPMGVVVVGTLAAASVLDDAGGRQEAFTMIEAGLFSTVTTELVKYAAGRERPDETMDSDRWRRDGSSFPSLHASAAFAIGTVFAESGNDEYRWLRRIVGYGMAAATGYERVKSNNHWASDVVAGAALGAATGSFLVNRRDHPSHREYGWAIQPLSGGAILAWTTQF